MSASESPARQILEFPSIPARRAWVVAQYQEHGDVSRIAAAVGRTTAVIYRDLRKMDAPRTNGRRAYRRKLGHMTRSQLLHAVTQAGSVRAAAERLGVSQQTLAAELGTAPTPTPASAIPRSYPLLESRTRLEAAYARYTQAEIAAAVGCGPARVAEALARHQIPLNRRRRVPAATVAEMVHLYQEEYWGLASLSRRTGFTEHTVRRALVEAGVVLRGRGPRKRPKKCVVDGCENLRMGRRWCAGHTSEWRRAKQSDPNLISRNKTRAAETSPARAEAAAAALKLPGLPDQYREVLRVAAEHPDKSLAEQGAVADMTKDAFWGRLRRALRAAEAAAAEGVAA